MPRRTAEEAKALILEAAQKRLAEGGPEAIRLQEVASDVGLSHPAILHHFGTREGLLEALAKHALDKLNAEVVGMLSQRDLGESTPERLLAQVREVLDRGGHARLLAWMALSGRLTQRDGEGQTSDDGPPMLQAIAQALHKRRIEDTSAEPPDYEDSEFLVLLVAAAMLGDALLGPTLRQSLGAPSSASENFDRLFVARLTGQ